MKNLVLAVMAFFMLSGFVFAESDTKGSIAPAGGQTVVFEEAGGPGPKHIDGNAPGPSPEDYDYGVDTGSEMPSYESYDPTTGLPNVVPSDTYGEIDE